MNGTVTVALGCSLLVLQALVQPPAQDKAKPERRAVAYTIDLDTSGGFHGRGRGGVTIDSDGNAHASSMGSSRNASCATTLSSDEIKALADAVASAQRQPWPPTFDPPTDNGCCDRFQHTLRLRLTDPNPAAVAQTLTAKWHESRADTLPKDIAVIRDISIAALKRALDHCKSGLEIKR